MRHQDHSGRAISLGLLALVILLIGSAHGVDRVVPSPYPTIQAAIDAADSGDTIQVNSGTYDEEVVVNKRLILKGSGLPIITSSTGDAITLTASDCTIRDFTVMGAGGVGIYVDNSDGHIIEHNTIKDNENEGIYVDGFDFGSDGHTIQNNNVTGNKNGGIVLDTSNTNIIRDNNVTNNYQVGIDVAECENNQILDNVVTGTIGDGISLEDAVNNKVAGNTVSNNDDEGILIDSSDTNTIECNLIENNGGIGISLVSGSIGNTIKGNTVSISGLQGINCDGSDDNFIYLNNFINNNPNARSDSSNTWISGTRTYVYGGMTRSSQLGNYWDDYSGSDADGNGIGNTPYIFSSEQDDYPLIESWPFDNETLSINGTKFHDVNANGVRDEGEPGISGWEIRLVLPNSSVLSTFTGENGSYTFDLLYPGEFNLSEVQKPGWIVTHPPNGSYNLALTNESITGNDFGNRESKPGIVVNKTANVSSAEVGDIVEYTIWVNNTGNVNLTGVRAEDNLTSTIWNVGTLLPGQNFTTTTSHRVNETDLPGPITNRLWANGTDPCGFEVNDSAIETVAILYNASIDVIKRANTSGPVDPGDVIGYNITVCNTGNVTVYNVTVQDNLTGTRNIGNLSVSECKSYYPTYMVTYQDACNGSVVNSARANGTDPCGFEVNDSAIETVSVLYDPGIEVEKTTNLSSGAPSTTTEFTINITNTGNVNLSSVNVTDYLPVGLEYVSDDQTTRTIDGDNVTWNLGPLNRTDTRTIKLVAHIDGTAFGTLSNRAEAAGTAPLGDEVTDDAEAEVDALKAEIEVEKTGEVDYGPASTNATFTIKVKNTGNITLTRIEVADILPAGLIYLSSNPAGTEVGNRITWPDIGSLAEAETAEIKIFTRVDGAASGSLTNEVTVTGTPEHGGNVTDQDNATVMATLDFGDAPDPSYPTLLVDDGARHVIVPGFMLGSEIDGEHDGQPTASATGDDLAGVDDEDGVAFTTHLVPGGIANVEVEATATGKLDAWIDFGGDGSWTATDQIFDSEPISSGTNYLQFAVPDTATPDVETFARFRFSTSGGLSPTGLADDGEVEDYAVEVLKDSDGDGAPDQLEPEGDRDGDGVPNYLDYDPSGYFYNDSDGQIITGGKIEVTGPGNVTIVEDGSGGRYEFWTDGTPGVYEMRLTFPGGYILSPTCPPLPGPFDPTNEPDDPVYLGSGENGATGYLVSNLCQDNPYYLRFDLEPKDPFVMTNNIPLAHLNSIGDRVWNDLDGDGCQDEGEAGVSGVPVTLLYENGTKLNETTTGPGGLYLFSELPPGGYRVKFDALSGCSFCPCHQCDERLDSDADPATGLTDLIVLETNENEMTIDAGLHTSLNVSKTVDKKSAKRGEELTYTIRICNLGNLTAKNVVVEDVFDKSVEFVSASPMPDPDGFWRFDEIPAGECVEIVLVVRVPKQDLEFEMVQGVSGQGFVNVANDYSTTLQPYVIKNNVKVTSGGSIATDSESVSISGEPGTELSTREHGSGSYESEEQVKMRTENKSISMEKDVAATYAPSTLGLYRNRTAVYTSKWTEEARAKNRITGTSMSESYRYAARIDRDSRMLLDKNGSTMTIDSEFEGRGHIGFLKKGSGSGARSASTFEAREDYVGSFKILEKVDEYGSAVSSEKAASGEGLVAVDKRVGDSQRSYESGTGTYDSEELIETNTNYIAKDISLVSGRMNLSSTDDFSINFNQKWKEGMYSKTPETSYIGEEYTSITELDKETVALGLNEMDTEANFSGRARYRAILKDEVDFDEEYDGDYSIERRVIFTGIAKYDRPHLNVTKTPVGGIVEEILPWGYGEAHLEGEIKKRKVATYNIRIENDGNKALGPVYVQDLFPPGAVYINASVRPSELTETYVNWTLMNIGIGDVANINLALDVTKYHPSELVNRVEVCGGINNGDEWICASNFSALEINWLTCCIVPQEEQLSVVKTAELDDTNPGIVRYKVEIRNLEDATRVATVTDRLPAGIKLIDSSIPFATYEDGVVVWNLIEISPSETATIEFSALAPGDGRFTNTIEVDPRSVDGPVVQPISATCVIDVGVVEDECGPVSCGIWQPPNWELEHYGYEPDQLTCEELTCTGCDGKDSCLAP